MYNLWTIAALVMSAILLYFSMDVLVPFIIAFILAYLLRPLIALGAHKFKLPSFVTILAVFLAFLVSIGAVVLLLTPLIYKQITIFISNLPSYKNNIVAIADSITGRLPAFTPEMSDGFSNTLESIVGNLLTTTVAFLNNIWSYTVATINIFTIMVLVPVLLYYILRDWEIITRQVESLVPAAQKTRAMRFITNVDRLLSAYIRGQLNICIALAGYYAICLSLIGVDLALLIGLLSGFSVIIPFVGILFSYIAASLASYFATGGTDQLWQVAAIYGTGYLIEGYFLTPLMIGNKIGLHPLWIMFAVFVGGNIFGLLGIIFAVPVAGIIKLAIKEVKEK